MRRRSTHLNPQTHKQAFIFQILALGALSAIGPLTVDMYLPALPEISRQFGVPLSAVELSLASYFLGLAIGQVFYGPFIDRFGRKRPLYFGLFLYFLSSIACFLAPSVHVLILARFAQALGGCASIVAPRAMVRDLFDERESARVFSLLMLVMGIAPILAPLIGGHISQAFGWRTIFFCLIVISALCILAAYFVLPETQKTILNPTRRPVIRTYFSILRDKRFLGPALAGSIAQAGMFVYITGSPFVFIELFGVRADRYGWIFGTNAVLLIGVSQLNTRLLKHYSPRRILQTVFPLLALASTLLILASVFELGLFAHVLPLALFVGLLGASFPNTTAAALAHEGARAGSASALLGTMQFTFAALAAALLSSLHTHSSLPMAAMIGVCGIGSFLISRYVFRDRGSKQPGPSPMVSTEPQSTEAPLN